LSLSKAISIIAILGFIIYFNALFNGFVMDDSGFIFNNPDVHSLNIVYLFSGNMFNSLGYYRPIPALYFALLYNVFGSQAFFYHFLQIGLHILNSVLVYLMLRTLLTRDPAKDAPDKELQSLSGSQRIKNLRMLRMNGTTLKTANLPDMQTNILPFFLSLIFLIHPINVESVAYIGATQSELLFLFGILALLVSMHEKFTLKQLFLISGLSLLALLTKEAGVLFLLMIVCFQFIFNRTRLLTIFIVELVTLVVYFFFRFAIGRVFFEKFVSHVTVPIEGLSLLERLANIPKIVLYYLNITFIPLRLAVWQLWIITRVTVQNFYLPLLLDTMFFIALCLGGVYIYIRKRTYFKAYLFFSVWFLSGLLLLLQIFPLDMTVADRWFYFPLVGLLGMLGIGVQVLLFSPNKHGVPLIKNDKAPMAAGLMGATLILLFSLRTIVRNANFHDQMTLYAHDAQIEDSFAIEDNLGVMYNQQRDLQASLTHLQKSVSLYPYTDNLFHLGNLYESLGNLQKAQEYYSKALTAAEAYYSTTDTHNRKEGNLDIYTRLTEVLLLTDKNEAAEHTSTKGLQYYPDSAILWEELALSEYKLHNQQEALIAVEKVKTLAPSDLTNFLYTKIVNKLPIQANIPIYIMNH